MKRRTIGLHTLIIILITVLFFQGCNKLSPIDNVVSSDIFSVETSYKSEIRKTIENYFSDYDNGWTYIIVGNQSDLCEIYECASIKPSCSSIFHIQGNVRDFNINNGYYEEYFKTGYYIAVLTTDSSGSWTFKCSATKNDGEIIVHLDGTLPAVSTCDIGGFIHLVPIDGVYTNETIKIVLTHTQLESHPADYYETTSSAETTIS